MSKAELSTTKAGFNSLQEIHQKQTSRLEILQKKYANEHRNAEKAKRDIE